MSDPYSPPALLPTSPSATASAWSGSAPSRTRAAIASAAQRTGADFSYLLAQARLESSLNPDARARTSSAAGLYQFIGSTWLETLDRHGSEHGLGNVATAIESNGARSRVVDPALRSQIMALRFDPETSALMAGELAQDNSAALTPVLGHAPDASELYLAHFLGAGGATRFLSALSADPSASAAALLPAAAAANRTIFYAPGGGARSLGQVMDLIRGKMATAMSAEGMPGNVDTGSPFAAARAQWASAAPSRSFSGRADTPAPGTAAMPSMADTLRTSFALTDSHTRSSAADHVQVAYGKLRAFGL